MLKRRRTHFASRPGGCFKPSAQEPIRPFQGRGISTTCLSCRESHLKCAGGPVCPRCARANKVCIFIPSRRGQRPKQHDNFNRTEFRPILTRNPPGTGTPEEQRALFFYCTMTLPTFLSFNPATKPFWGQLVPQVSQSEAAIRKILVACLSWNNVVTPFRNNKAYLSLTRNSYSNALKILSRQETQPSVVVILTACLLLALRDMSDDPRFESNDAWLLHALSGLKILREWKQKFADQLVSERDLIMNDIEPCFLQLEYVVGMFNPALKTILNPSLIRPKVPNEFTNTTQPQETFFAIHRWRYNCPSDCDWTTSSPLFRDINDLLTEWYQTFLKYLGEHTRRPIEERQKVAVLWVQYRSIQSALRFSVRTDISESKYYSPLLIDISQPGTTVTITGTATSTAAGRDDLFQRAKELSTQNLEGWQLATPAKDIPLGLWPMKAIWRGKAPHEDIIRIDTQVPGYESGGIPLNDFRDCEAVKSPECVTSSHHEAHKSLEFIDVADPQWRRRARSHLTRQQHQVYRRDGASAGSDRLPEVAIAPKFMVT